MNAHYAQEKEEAISGSEGREGAGAGTTRRASGGEDRATEEEKDRKTQTYAGEAARGRGLAGF